MKLIVCAIKDHAIDAFLAPWYARTENEAVRQFQLACTQHDTPMRAQPQDYDLFKLGTWDDHTAKHVDEEMPILLCRGSGAKPNGEDTHPARGPGGYPTPAHQPG